MTSLHIAAGTGDEIAGPTLRQILRLLRFDGAVLYAAAPDGSVLWPMMQSGIIRNRVPPVLPGVGLIGATFRSVGSVTADAATIGTDGEAWLRGEAARTVVALPLAFRSVVGGVLVIFSRAVVEVDLQSLRAVSLCAAQLTAALRREPLWVTTEMQRRQIDAVLRIISAATGGNIHDERTIFRTIAQETRLLTGASIVGFARGIRLEAFAQDRNGGVAERSFVVGSRRMKRPSTTLARTVVRRALPAQGITLTLSWAAVFEPTADQRRLVELIAAGLAAAEDLRARVELADRERRAQYLADVGKALSVSLDFVVLIEQIHRLFVPTSADRVAVNLIRANGPAPATDAVDPRTESERCSLHRAVQASASTSERILRGLADRLHFEPPLDDEICEAIVVPMIGPHGVIGSIAFGRSTARGRATSDERAYYAELTSFAATAIAHAASFRKERDTADILQHALLPTVLPGNGRLVFDAAYFPAGAEAHVGGDWYDVFPLDDERFAVSIGDVGGHGTRAAVTMNVVRLGFRAAALGENDPLRVLERGDAMLALEDDPPLVTALYGIIDLRRNVFSYACAGHLPPLLVREDGTIDELPTLGLPLGIGTFGLERIRFETPLGPGDTLVLYTDGLVEYGRDLIAGDRRLREVLRTLVRSRPRATLARDVHAAVFSDAIAQHDDAAVLTISLRPVTREMEWRMPAVPSSAPVLRGVLREFWSEAPCAVGEPSEFLLATGEAIANCVEHAYPDATGAVSVRARYDESGIVVEIADQGRFKTGGSGSQRGFGTGIMRALTSDLTITGRDDGTLVQLTFR